jgi:hypothetical protein
VPAQPLSKIKLDNTKINFLIDELPTLFFYIVSDPIIKSMLSVNLNSSDDPWKYLMIM